MPDEGIQFSFTSGGIPFEELGGSPTISITQKKTTAKRVFRVNWSDWADFADEVIGGPGAGFFGFGSINDPSTFPAWDNMYVENIEIEPFEPESPTGGLDIWTQTNAYDGGAKITVSYESKDPNDDKDGQEKPEAPEGTFLTVSFDVGAEFQTLPGRTWTYVTDNKPLPADTNPGVLIPTNEVTYSWERVPNPPWVNIAKATGCISDFGFPSPFGGGVKDSPANPETQFPAGTLLFLGAKASRQFANLTEQALWKLDYRFSQRIVRSADGIVGGWNYFFRSNAAAAGQPVSVEKIQDAAGNQPYTSLPYAFDNKVLGLFVNRGE